MNKKIIMGVTAIAIAAVFGVIIYFVTKQFQATCISGMHFDNGLKICRPTCGEDGSCDPSADPTCTHYSKVGNKCVTCSPGTLWSKNKEGVMTCIEDCNKHGFFNPVSGGCECQEDPGPYPPDWNGKTVNGWTGSSCQTAKSTCTLALAPDLYKPPAYFPQGPNPDADQKTGPAC